MKMDQKISVIMPVYNVERYLRAALDCVRLQTYQHLEIICVLDAPTDESANIAMDIARQDARIKLVTHTQNQGLASARNTGMEHATGAYIHFMDADDLISYDFYETLLRAANATGADVCACSVFYEQKPKQSIWFTDDEVVQGPAKIHKSEVLYRGWAWRYLIKKTLWDTHAFSFPNYTPMQDIVVSISLIQQANKVAICPEAVYFYKNRSSSILNRNRSTDSPQQKQQWAANVSRTKSTIKTLIRNYHIKRPAKRLLWLKERLRGKFICHNDAITYGSIHKKISVVVPIYNAEKYVARTLNSIRFQTYRHLEIICVLDCPTDRSTEIVSQLAAQDSRIKLVMHRQNSGLPAARHTGVDNASGEYIHFMDADDWLSPDFYDILIHAAEEAEADVAACSVFYEKKPIKSIWFRKTETVVNVPDKLEKTEVTMRGWAWRYLIRRKLWNERQLTFPDLVPMEDTPAMVKTIYYANKVVLCPSALYCYKNREGSILNKRQDPARAKKASENRHKARGVIKAFLATHRVRRPSRLRYYLGKYMPY